MMERKGGCCLAPRYAAGAQAGQAWHLGKVVLKFRPIAPKPAAMAPAPVTPVPAGKEKRKRKAVAGPGGTGRRGRKPKKSAAVAVAAAAAASTTQKLDYVQDKPLSSPSSSSSGTTSVSSPPPPPLPATLALMPVLPAQEGFGGAAPVANLAPAHVARLVLPPQALRQPVPWVTVEDVTGIWRHGEEPYAAVCGGEEAPTFVSDQCGRVTWTNVAFNRTVSGREDDDAAMAPSAAASEVRVVLAAKDGTPVPAWGSCAGFTCRVRVPYACPRRGSLVAPCDVWRLDAGGYLWRLDLQATLSLSLGGFI
ncbi:hypothetical protein ZWY2020_010819 [Hordeum vulgare]|nr:hypothetical protein ZWY2020_010819 [Hordeum vulgare]